MPASALLNELTPREREILALIGEGHSLPEIAQKLHRSVKTIETHRLTLGKKLNASNRVELARLAISTGLVTLEPEHDDQPNGEVGRLTGDTDSILLAMIQQLDERIGSATGATYIRLLSCALPEVLGVDFAGVCDIQQVDGEKHFRVIAMSNKGHLSDSLTYAMRDTPCAIVYEKGMNACDSNVQQQYPKDDMLKQIGAQAYIGVRLDRFDAERLGILWVLHTQPRQHDARQVIALLKHCANRCAGELSQTIDALRDLEREERAAALSQPGLDAMLLHRSHARMDALLNVFQDFAGHMHDGVLVLDAALLIRHVNPAMAGLFGYTAEEMVGMPVSDILLSESWEKYRDEHARACESGEALSLRMTGRHRDGRTLPLAIARAGLFDYNASVAGTLALVSLIDPQ